MRRSAGWVVVVLGVAACAQTSPVFDARFGQTTRALLAAQVRDPNPARTHPDRDADTLDGPVARETMLRYQQSFAKPPAPGPVFNIGVGGGAGSGGEAK